jgi:hypothetical protein
MLHFHVYLSRIDKSGRIKPRRIHKLILVELFSLEHGICKIQDCLAGGGIMYQLMWQIYSRTSVFFFASTLYYNFESLCRSRTTRDLYYYIFLHFLNLIIPSPTKFQRGYIHVITLPAVHSQHVVHVKTLHKIVNRNGKCFKETTTQPKSGKQ